VQYYGVGKENCVSNFLHYWGRCGGETPAERGSGKAVGFEARGETSPLIKKL